ncbi:MAG TPA: lysophospholipid acyltransferase family protein [Gemmatimonadaceae bacterium]|nr:lysophospholipid acyltransferase family protein [Gemmatimonadaceae bacterium]
MTHADHREARKARRLVRLSRLGGVILRVLARTWRIRYLNREPVDALIRSGQPVVLVLWHGELLPLLWTQRVRGLTVLISEHGDGEIVARVALSLGYRTVRGSTSRGGGRALLGMSRAIEEDRRSLAFTPDGPRGPARSFAPGALIVAQRAGAPVVTMAAGASRAWRLRSWDAFLIPKPFARVTVAYGDPVVIEASSARKAAELACRFETLLNATSAAANGD